MVETDKNKIQKPTEIRYQQNKVWEWANTRKSYWRISNSFILARTLTNDRLKSWGYISALDYYNSINL